MKIIVLGPFPLLADRGSHSLKTSLSDKITKSDFSNTYYTRWIVVNVHEVGGTAP